MDLLEEGNEVVFAASMEFVRTFSSTSRPALRAAACGGRPRAGNDTTEIGEPAPPSTSGGTAR
jgi:hypothetical protein